MYLILNLLTLYKIHITRYKKQKSHKKYIIIIKKCYILKKNIYVCVINLKKIQNVIRNYYNGSR